MEHVLLCGVLRESRRLCMQSHHLSIAVGEHKKIASGELPYVPGSVLDSGGIVSRHDGSSDWEVGHEFRGAGQHDFAIVLEILEGDDGISQILHNAIADMALDAVPDNQKAHRGEARGYEQHREQKTRAQPGARDKRASGLSWKSV